MAIKRIHAEVDVRNLGHLRLWRDDLEAMANIITECASIDSIVVDGDFSIDSVEDLARYDRPDVTAIEITAGDGKVNLSLSRTEATLTLTDPTLEIRGMAEAVGRRTQRRRRQLYSSRFLLLSVAASFAVLLSAIWLFDWRSHITAADQLSSIIAAIAAIAAISTSFWTVGSGGRRKGSATLSAKTRAEAPPWLSRNKDSLVTNAIVSLVFLIIGVIVGYLLPKS